jgi:diacylglycerol kinase family enzyme
VLSDPEPFTASLDIDGEKRSLECLQVTIANGIHYGGGMTVSDEAGIDDGMLTVLCIQRQPAWDLASHALALRNGNADEVEEFEIFNGTKVRLETSTSMPASADGELVAETPLDCECRPGILPVFAPALHV